MPAILSPLEKTQQALELNVPISEKISALRALSASIGDNIQAQQVEAILSVIPLSQFYHALIMASDNYQDNNENETLTKVICDLLLKLFYPFPYSYIVQGENKHYLIHGLEHFSPLVRSLSLQLVDKCNHHQNDALQMLQSDILLMVATTIAFQETNVADKAVDILYKACGNYENCQVFFNSSCIPVLEQLMHVNETVSFRVYDLVMKIAGLSEQHFRLCEDSRILHQLLVELESNDLLLKMNAIELLSNVASTPSGLQFLIQSHALNNYIVPVLDIEDDQDIAVVLTKCAVLKFIGNLASKKDVDFNNIQNDCLILEKLEKAIDSNNKEIETVTLSCVGLIGSHLNGLSLIQNSLLLSKFMSIASTASGDTKATVHQSLSKLIGVSDDTNNSQVEQLTLEVYQSLPDQPNTIKNLISTVKQPVENIRIAGFSLFESIGSHQWGRQVLSQSPEFFGYILDRSNEHTQEGQMWKYGIIKVLVDGNDPESIFGRHYPLLQQYIRQGPYYQQAQAITAMESG
ncbi:unnamed protein product [Cunninghamella blakesleeana]